MGHTKGPPCPFRVDHQETGPTRLLDIDGFGGEGAVATVDEDVLAMDLQEEEEEEEEKRGGEEIW